MDFPLLSFWSGAAPEEELQARHPTTEKHPPTAPAERWFVLSVFLRVQRRCGVGGGWEVPPPVEERRWGRGESPGPGSTGLGGGTVEQEHLHGRPGTLGVPRCEHGGLVSPCTQASQKLVRGELRAPHLPARCPQAPGPQPCPQGTTARRRGPVEGTWTLTSANGDTLGT